jgi:hypothetical protein
LQQASQDNQEPHLETEDCNDQQQDFEEEIKVSIVKELAYHHQENEHLRLKQENMMR